MGSNTGKIGPNAIIQLGETLTARGALDKAAEVYAKAGCLAFLAKPPAAMVEEQYVQRLFTATTDAMEKQEAESCLQEAGNRTGSYILENRIPRVARLLLPLLPTPLALGILLRAIARHSWTFAGSGEFIVELGRPTYISIHANSVATRLGCIWHKAVFERLFGALLRSKVEVDELSCCGKGDHSCRFRITLS